MRNFITLITAATLVVACADDSRPTAPASRSASPTMNPTADKAPVDQSKPVDLVGFTKITRVVTGPGTIHVPAGSGGEGSVTCPAGTTVVSGGYEVMGYDASTLAPRVLRDGTDGANGWRVSFSTEAPQMGAFNFYVFAYCLS